MKKKLALLAAPIVLLAASAATAENRWGFTPYVGADAEFRHMDFQKNFGSNVVNHAYPQGNVYAGTQLNEYLAVEAGYEATKRKTRTSTVRPGDILDGVTISAANGTLQLNTTSQVKGLHANLVGFLPICDRLQAIGLIGMARLENKSTLNFVSQNGTSLPQTSDIVTTFKTRKSVLRLGAGLQHMIDCNWGVRGMLKWEATKKLKMSGQNTFLANTLSIRAKNSVIYSIGAFYKF